MTALRRVVLSVTLASALSVASAATLYVDASLGSATCTNYDPANRACASGSAQAFRTVAAASAVAQPGDTVLIRSGSYAEQLRPAASGTANNPITYRASTGENVYFTSAPGVNLTDRSYIVLDGIRVEDRAWLEATNAHYCVVQNCTFLRNPNGGTTGNVRFISSHYNKILNCRIESGTDNIVLFDSNRNLVEGNTLQEGRHSLITIRCSDYNVVRNNFMANTIQKIAEVYDCGADTSAVPNAFDSTSHNVFEWNVFADAYNYYSTSAGNGIQYAGQDGIIRFNVFYNCNVGIGMQRYGDEALYNEDNRVYHNVFYQNDGAGISLSTGSTRNSFFNNILLGNKGCNSDCDAVSPGQIVYRSPVDSANRFRNNSILYQTAGQAVMEPLFSGGVSIASFSSSNPNVIAGSLEVDPQFVDGPAHDFRLQSTSPMINAGAFLTTTTAAGSGRVLTVADARCFLDGFGIAGLSGDTIQLQGQTQTARVVAVNYTTNQLTLDTDLTWTSGLGVTMPYSGSAPDIGAYEFSSETLPAAPSTLQLSSGS